MTKRHIVKTIIKENLYKNSLYLHQNNCYYISNLEFDKVVKDIIKDLEEKNLLNLKNEIKI